MPEVLEFQFEPDVLGHIDAGLHRYILAGCTCLPGDVFGEMAILTGGARTSSVEAWTDVELGVVTEKTLKEGIGLDTWLGKFVHAVAERFLDNDAKLRALLRSKD